MEQRVHAILSAQGFGKPNFHPSCSMTPQRGLGFGVDAPLHRLEVLFENRLYLFPNLGGSVQVLLCDVVLKSGFGSPT